MLTSQVSTAPRVRKPQRKKPTFHTASSAFCTSWETGLQSGRRTWQIGGEDTGDLCRRNLLWGETQRPVLWHVFMLGQLRSNSSAVTSRQSGTRTHLGYGHLGVVFKLIELYPNCKGDQILTCSSKVQPFALTQLILGCVPAQQRFVQAAACGL